MEDLHSAILGEDVDRMQLILHESPNLLTEVDGEGLTALQHAVMLHKTQAIQTLVQLGADVNSTHNWETLHWAVRDNNIPVVELLLQAGANPDVVDADNAGATPLTRAAKDNYMQIIRLLLAAGCDINLPGIMTQTALSIVIDNCHRNAPNNRDTSVQEDCIRLLLQNGADPTIQNNLKGPPLVVAAGTPIDDELFKEIFLIAKSKWNPDQCKFLLAQSILRAINEGSRYRERVMFLIDFMDLLSNDFTVKHRLLMHLLCGVCHVGEDLAMAEAILSKSNTPLIDVLRKEVWFAAIHFNRSCLVKHFLLTGADPNTFPASVHKAFQHGFRNIAVGLLQAGWYMPDTTSNAAILAVNMPHYVTNFNYPSASSAPVDQSCIILPEREDIYETLYQAGILLSKHYKVFSSGPGGMSTRFIKYQAFPSLEQSPRRLKDISRLKVREVLRKPLVVSLLDLPLPSSIIDYLFLRDIPDYLL